MLDSMNRPEPEPIPNASRPVWELVIADPAPQPKCPDCNTPLRRVFADAPGPAEYVCPVAMEAQRRGLLGQPGRKHKAVWVYTAKPRAGAPSPA